MIKPAKLTMEKRERLAALGVGVLYLFGSRARGVAGEKSDYDIGVVFADTDKEKPVMERHSAVYDILSDIFPDEIGGPKLDISFLREANAALQMSAVRYGVVIAKSFLYCHRERPEGARRSCVQDVFEIASSGASTSFRCPSRNDGDDVTS